MTIKPEVLDALLAAGATAEMIVAAVKADARQEELRLQDKREKDAARQRRSRASRAVTQCHSDNADAPPNDIYSNPPQEPQIAKAISTPLAETAERIVAAWNEAIVGTPLPKARELTKDRLKHLKARLAEHSEADVIQAIRGMVASDWHSGKSGQWTEGNLGWLLKSPENFAKMLEKAQAVKPATPAKSPEEWQEYCLNTAKHFDDRGNQHEAAEWRRKAGVRADRPPGSSIAIGDLVQHMAGRA